LKIYCVIDKFSSFIIVLQIYHVKEPYILSKTHFLNDVRNDYQPFPKLEKAFTDVDPSVGFNIELKWTMKLQVIIYYSYVIYINIMIVFYDNF